MCDTTFAFGHRGTHFVQCPSRREFSRLPIKLERLLTSKQVKHIHHVTLGHENSFLITYRDRAGGDRIESQHLPTEVDDFIYAKNSNNLYIRNIPKLRVSLGPYNNSFFAHDQSAYLWMNLPPALLTALQTRIKDGAWLDKPRIVTLGADSNFLMITEKHAAIWDLQHYQMLAKMLEFSRTQEHGIEGVRNVVLHAHRYQGFVAQSRNGTVIHDNLPPEATTALHGMRDAIIRDTKEEERRRKQGERRMEVRTTEREPQRRPSMNQQASLRREWSDRKEQFNRESKGLKLSLSLSISAGGIRFGKVLG